jgi:adenine-specific DNA methylase
MSRTELDRLPNYERQILGAGVIRFYYDLPLDIPRPANMSMGMNANFWGEARTIGNTLDNPETLAGLLAAMRPIMENTPAADRYYDARKTAFDNLTAFENGAFTLFPQLSAVQASIETPVISATPATSAIPAMPTPPARTPITTAIPQAAEQLSLFFPTEAEQIAVIQEAERIEIAALPAVVTQDDIDNALREWNGSANSKIHVYEYMSEYARARETAHYLAGEFDGGRSDFIVTKDGAEPVTLPWAKVQRRIAQLMDAGQFLTADERALAIAGGNSEPEAIPEQRYSPIYELYLDIKNAQPENTIVLWKTGDFYEMYGADATAAAGILGLTLTSRDMVAVNVTMCGIPSNRLEEYAAALTQNGYGVAVTNQDNIGRWFVSEVIPAAIEEPAAPAVTEEQTAENVTVPYAIGDAVYLENDRRFVIEEITYREVKLLDPNLYIPITRAMDIADFEREFFRNTKNQAVPSVSVTDEMSQSEPVMGITPETNDIPIQSEPETRQSAAQTPVNFRITDEHLGEGGAKTKYGFNTAAIRTLQTIEAEGRLATPEEQAILSKYVGWGGIPQAFDADNDGWKREYGELRELLSPEEYDSARASTLNAHYTTPVVIKAIYDAVERMGFKDGNLLEPSMGVGNFFGLLPDSMKNAKLYGVELDGVTGRIAKQLYQNADIKVTGFEKTDMPDAFFDVAVGNVPFGNFGVVDKRYEKHNFHIHDYFFAKALDQVRPGGVVALVTSKFTLDKQDPKVRKYIAQRAELLGAVRLPNDAFLKNAGTETTMDIIFLQKRDRLIDIEPEWVHLGRTEDGIPVNSYFLDNPEMMLGVMGLDEHMNNKYGRSDYTACLPIEGADLAEQLRAAMSNIRGEITETELDDIEGIQDVSIPADPDVRNFSYTISDDTVYFRENSRMYPVDMPAATLERVKGMTEMRDCVYALIDYQLYDYPEADIRAKQTELGELYDRFSRRFGLVNDSANYKAFQADSAYYLLCSLEILDENGALERKSDMFTKRTIKQKTVITSVDTASEALAVSIGQKAKVDMGFMMGLTGFTKEKIAADLNGVIFRDLGEQDPSDVPIAFYDPAKRPFVTADEYLSGNVRNKLRLAKSIAEKRPDLAPKSLPTSPRLSRRSRKTLTLPKSPSGSALHG